MKLLMLITADYASVDQATGKLNILGAFRSIWAKDFPARHRAMSVVVQLGGEFGDHKSSRALSVALTDADGTEIFRAEGVFRLPRAPVSIQPEYNIILELRDVVFPHPGVYGIYVAADGEAIGNTSIELAQLPSPQE